MEKLDIRRVKLVVELVKARMRQDQRAALTEQGLVAVHVEVITQGHHLNEYGIQSRIDVVWRDVRNAGDHDVALSFNRDLVLPIVKLEDLLVDRLGLAREAADQL